MQNNAEFKKKSYIPRDYRNNEDFYWQVELPNPKQVYSPLIQPKRKCPQPESPDKIDCVLFHGWCADGFMAAAIAFKYFENKKEKPFFKGCEHNKPHEWPDVTGKNVIILDFSFPRSKLVQMMSVASSLILLDHHDTAVRELSDIENCHFDLEHSGATLSWFYFFPGMTVPTSVLYFEDRDLWNWKMEKSREFSLAVYIDKEMKFEDYLPLINDDSEKSTQETIEKGTVLMKYKNKLIEKQVYRTKPILFFGLPSRIVNCVEEYSEVGERILEKFKDARVAIMYQIENDGIIKVHLRARKSEGDQGLVHVGIMAKFFGGGGHPGAASFSFEEKWTIDKIIEDTQYMRLRYKCRLHDHTYHKLYLEKIGTSATSILEFGYDNIIWAILKVTYNDKGEEVLDFVRTLYNKSEARLTLSYTLYGYDDYIPQLGKNLGDIIRPSEANKDIIFDVRPHGMHYQPMNTDITI
jgi:nanoRNase/pAp phosphatase (c-di-AMP/oligoRNAs hydrolase)